MRLTAEQPPLMGGLKAFLAIANNCYRFSFSDLFTDFFGMVMAVMVMVVMVMRVKLLMVRVAKVRMMVVMVIEWWPPVSLSK